jgi:hypothetical protein
MNNDIKQPLPCPFCDGKPVFSSVYEHDDRRYYRMDLECCAKMIVSMDWSEYGTLSFTEAEAQLKAELTEEWNCRPDAALQQEEKENACRHEFHYFGDQVAKRRCINCNKLESAAESSPPLPLQEGQTANMPELPMHMVGLDAAQADLNATEEWLDSAMCDMPEGMETSYETVSAYAAAIITGYRALLVAAVSPQGGEATAVYFVRSKAINSAWAEVDLTLFKRLSQEGANFEYRTLYAAAPIAPALPVAADLPSLKESVAVTARKASRENFEV